MSQQLGENKKFMKAFGLSHTLSELEEMDKNIYSLIKEEQAEYADAVCKENAQNIFFLEDQLAPMSKEKIIQAVHLKKLNSTSVGNIAYLALYAHPTWKPKADELWNTLMNTV